MANSALHEWIGTDRLALSTAPRQVLMESSILDVELIPRSRLLLRPWMMKTKAFPNHTLFGSWNARPENPLNYIQDCTWNAIFPPKRRRNKYAKNNKIENLKLAGRTDAQFSCQNSVAVTDLMNNDDDRYFGRNFTNLYFGREDDQRVPPWARRRRLRCL